MTTVALHNLDLSKIKRSTPSDELTAFMQEYIRLDDRMRAQCQREGKPVPLVTADEKR